MKPGDRLWCTGHADCGIVAQWVTFLGQRMSGNLCVALDDGSQVTLAPSRFRYSM